MRSEALSLIFNSPARFRRSTYYGLGSPGGSEKKDHYYTTITPPLISEIIKGPSAQINFCHTLRTYFCDYTFDIVSSRVLFRRKVAMNVVLMLAHHRMISDQH